MGSTERSVSIVTGAAIKLLLDVGQEAEMTRPVSLGGVSVDIVEDVDKDKEEGDEQRHAARDDVGWDEEGDPGDQDKEA